MRVEVTEEDIDRGMRHDPHCCAVARGIHRAVGLHVGDRVSVGSRDCTIQWGKARFRGEIPDEVGQFIDAFDEGFKVKPFSFELDLIEAGGYG